MIAISCLWRWLGFWLSLSAAVLTGHGELALAQDTSAQTNDGAGAGSGPRDGKLETAQVIEARKHFQRGVEYFGEGDYRGALIEMRRAYELQPNYRLLYNLGQVAAELRDYADAEQYLRRYLTEGGSALTAERRREVLDELERLTTRVASLYLSTNLSGATILIDDRVIADAVPGPVRVSAGTRHIVAEKRGYAPVQRVIDLIGGEDLTVRLTFGPPIVQPTVAVVRPKAVSEPSSPSNALPWITGVTSGVLLIAAGGVGYWATRDAAAYDRTLDGYTSRDELDRLSSHTTTKALIADVLLGVGVVGATVTLITALSGTRSEAAGREGSRSHSLSVGANGLRASF